MYMYNFRYLVRQLRSLTFSDRSGREAEGPGRRYKGCARRRPADDESATTSSLLYISSLRTVL